LEEICGRVDFMLENYGLIVLLKNRKIYKSGKNGLLKNFAADHYLKLLPTIT